jgi:hypothetical protein
MPRLGFGVKGEPCGSVNCTASVDGDDGFCSVHRVAKVAGGAFAGQTCLTCRAHIKPDDLITRESYQGYVRHAHCQPRAKRQSRRQKKPTPLFDQTE